MINLKKEKVTKFENFPNWAVCYLLYGDDSGLTEEDKRDFNAWCNKEKINVTNLFDVSEETYFALYPQFGLACNCCDLTMIEL